MINDAIKLSPKRITSTLEKRYTESDMVCNIPGFGSYISDFIFENQYLLTDSLFLYSTPSSFG